MVAFGALVIHAIALGISYSFGVFIGEFVYYTLSARSAVRGFDSMRLVILLLLYCSPEIPNPGIFGIPGTRPFFQ